MLFCVKARVHWHGGILSLWNPSLLCPSKIISLCSVGCEKYHPHSQPATSNLSTAGGYVVWPVKSSSPAAQWSHLDPAVPPTPTSGEPSSFMGLLALVSPTGEFGNGGSVFWGFHIMGTPLEFHGWGQVL